MPRLAEVARDAKHLRLALLRADGTHMPVGEAVREMQAADSAVGAGLTAAIAGAPWDAVFFEMPPVTADTLDTRAFELVLLPAPALSAVGPDADAFAEHTRRAKPADSGVVSFANLGGDAKLVVPCPQSGTPAAAYTHLRRFVTSAPAAQVAAFWRRVGREVELRVRAGEARRTWVSTSGLGVYWLHMRLDTTPKYYNFAEFKHDGSGKK